MPRHHYPRLFHQSRGSRVEKHARGSAPRSTDTHRDTSNAGTGERAGENADGGSAEGLSGREKGPDRCRRAGRGDSPAAAVAAAARPFHLKSSCPFKGRCRRRGAAAPTSPCRGRCRPVFGAGGGRGPRPRGWRGGPSAGGLPSPGTRRRGRAGAPRPAAFVPPAAGGAAPPGAPSPPGPRAGAGRPPPGGAECAPPYPPPHPPPRSPSPRSGSDGRALSPPCPVMG